MKILLSKGLNIKSYYEPIIKATAQELADTGKIIWKRTQNNNDFPKKYKNGKNFAKIINKEQGNIFSKKIFGQYELTPKGKNWIDEELFVNYLPKNTSIGTFMKTIIRKTNYLKKYARNLFRPPF